MRIVTLTFLAALCVVGAAEAQQPKSGWIADPKSGCKVWNENPIANEHISWSGPCVGGIANGNGTLQWYANNKPTDRYVGELGNGRENGQGAYYWPEGARYEGAWKDGKAHGFGTRVNAQGKVFTGQWVNGCFDNGTDRAWVGVERADCGFR
ncbi:MAG: hypothetical protein FJX20_05160 [Alphaproteobacteria bacterium]|nr:hypothetical protein [Alphaproteobacteria bacterium]